MGHYYYLVSQLPLLQFGAKPHINREALLAEAKKWLTGGEYVILSGVKLAETKIRGNEPRILKKYKNFEKQLRTELKKWREARDEGTEHKPSLFSAGLIKDSNPLETEEKLLELRWNFLDKLETGQHFDFSVLIIYNLRLQILEKIEEYDKQVGQKKFKHYTEVNL